MDQKTVFMGEGMPCAGEKEEVRARNECCV